ncbi:intradiol ring-cleavage dioxygenase [Streptomyces sp. KA12]|uniref:intradiol ring-cleavage dioxygenase n=1 Tax=Streptomyces sp. KA12 TaxID=2991730 RepID=UPI0023B064DB|nr:intradiol ring-cleavage dioxygenase [Streptomyces sp. KA12]MDF0371310.1 intradiol ring-cleavage dioxygenase [Streptomyces sp. KA12]
MTENQGPAHKKDMTRRRVIMAGGAVVAAAGVGAGVVATASAGEGKGAASAAKAGQGEVCYRLTSETTEGPYYIDADKIRKDITEDKEGIPLTLRLKVIDSDTCKPLRKAAVDIWHCDALGIYSGYESMSQGGPGGGAPPSGAPTDDERYLRGTQLTDQHGFVEFTTIFPGWYQGRAVHIHTKVHVGGTMTDAGYEGGHTCHTGQFFFAESAVLDSAKEEPYSTSTTTRTTLTEDTIYDRSGVAGGLLKLSYRKGGMARGVTGSITMGVDPDETHDGTDL